MWRRLIPVLMVVMLAAVACGDDGESVFEQGGLGQGEQVVGEQGGGEGVVGEQDGGEGVVGEQGGGEGVVGEQGGGEGVVGEQGGGEGVVGEQGGGEGVFGELGAAEQAMADQIAADMLAEGVAGETGLSIDQEAAQCLGNQIVATFGLDRLQELEAAAGSAGDLGLAMENMTPEEQATLVGVILNGAGGQGACLDVQGMIADALTESGLSESSAQCVAQAFTEGEFLQNLMGLALSSGGEAIVSPGGAVGPPAGSEGGEVDAEILTQLMTVLMGCLTPEELAEMGDLGDLGG